MRQSSAPLALLALLLLVGGGGAFWFLTRDSGAGDTAAMPEAANPGAAAAISGGAPSEGTDPEEPTRISDDRLSVTDPTWADLAPEIDEESAVWVEGFVDLAESLPADEVLEVWALSEPVSRRRLEEWVKERSTRVEKALVGVERVQPDGTFRIAFPKDEDGNASGGGNLVLLGRYTYASEEILVDLSAPEPVTFEAQLGSWIKGRVILPPGVQYEDAAMGDLEVELELDRRNIGGFGAVRRLQGFQDRDVEVDKDLEFEFWGVPAAISLTLRVEPEKFAVLKSAGFETVAGEIHHQSLQLTPGGIVSGFVRNATGEPIADADVSARQQINVMQGNMGTEVREARTAADGSFEMQAVAAGNTTVTAEQEGYLEESESLEVEELGTHGGMNLVLTQGERIAGLVLMPDGSPAADAEINVSFDMSQIGGMGGLNALRGASGSAKSNEDGTFSIDGLGKGPFTVRSQLEVGGDEEEGEDADDDESIKYKIRVDGVEPGTLDLALRLEEPIGVHGFVVDDLGEPVVQFKILATSKTQGMIPGIGSDSEREEFEDEEGKFFLDGLATGTWNLVVLADRYGVPESVEVTLPQAPGDELQLVVQRAAIVSGVVFDTTGAPVADATVGLELSLSNIASVGRTMEERPDAMTDGEGKFTLSRLTPGVNSLVANAEGFASSAPYAVEIAPGEELDDVQLSLRMGGTLVGTVFNNEGELADSATVMVQVPGKTLMPNTTTTDHQGYFEVEHLTPGNWQIIAMVGGGPEALTSGDTADLGEAFKNWKFTWAEIEEGEITEIVLGAPPEDPVKVTGRVSHPGGLTRGLMISFIASGGGGMEKMRFDTTDEDGFYGVQLDEPGEYLVSVQEVGAMGAQNSVEFNEEIPASEEHKLDIALPIGRISGRVTGPDGPVSGARISLVTDGPIASGTMLGGRYTEIKTDSEGNFDINWLREGTYSLACGGPILGGILGSDSTFGRQVHEAISLREEQWIDDVDFHLEAGANITGRIVDGSGRPVPEAAIFVRDGSGRLLERFSFVTSDGAGKFTYKGVTPGSYLVSARKEDLASHEVSVEIREGKGGMVEISLDSGTLVIVSLTDREGTPQRASITVTDPAGRQVNGMFSLAEIVDAFSGGVGFSSTEQRVGPLPPGKYTIMAEASDGRSANKSVTLKGQPERRVRLRLRGP